MMCACDEAIGRRFLSHQLRAGSELETRERVPVTAGFQPNICRECRGLSPEAHPVAEIYGRSSKIKRYYWREIAFRGMELMAQWAEAQGLSEIDQGTLRQRAEEQALEEIKALHASAPKYKFESEPQEKILRECGVNIIELDATYVRGTTAKKAQLLDGETVVEVEAFAARYFQRLGYCVFALESRPFHVLFGTFMWLLIQDPADPLNRLVGFGDRKAFEMNRQSEPIWTFLPQDFGAPGYGKRRASFIDEHLASTQMEEREELQWLFDYWLNPSENFRQYLWAYRQEDVETARRLIEVLPGPLFPKLLRYLVEDYWGRYLGWPDLFAHKGSDYLFVEVKSSGDKLSEDQRRWIKDNHSRLKLPFALVKIRKAKVVDAR